MTDQPDPRRPGRPAGPLNEDHQLVLDLYLTKGMRPAEIATELGWDRAKVNWTIQYLRREAGVIPADFRAPTPAPVAPKRQLSVKLTQAEEDAMRDACEDGETISDILRLGGRLLAEQRRRRSR